MQDANACNANEVLTNEYLSYLAESETDEADRRAAWNYIVNSTAVWDGNPVYMGYVPRLFSQDAYNLFKTTSETLYDILGKVIKEYQSNPEYRALFKFDERLEQLTLAPTGYTDPLPITRVDCFLNEDTGKLRFCEFNTDGTSGMNENREAFACIAQSEPYRRLAQNHALSNCDTDLFSGWVDTFLSIYSRYDAKVEKPRIAIVDFLENAAFEEFKVYAGIFKERGFDISIFDVRKLSFDGEHLHGKNAAWGDSDVDIDVIWRRTVASDLLEHWDESQPLVQAYLAHKVCLIGGFATNIVHDKQVFRVLHRPETAALLTEKEATLVKECIPFTTFLDPAEIDIDEVKANPARWVLKPSDGYCSKNVTVGHDCDAETWAKLIDESLAQTMGTSQRFLVQECCELYKTATVPLYGKDEDFTAQPVMFNNLTGLYLMGGRFSGVFNRLGPGAIIMGRKGGVTSATVWVDVDASAAAE